MAIRRRKTTTRRSPARRATPRKKSGLVSSLSSAASRVDLKVEVDSGVSREIWAIIYLTLGVLFAVSIWFDALGVVGSWMNAAFRELFGWSANLIPIFLFVLGGVMLGNRQLHFNFTKVLGIILLCASFLGLVHLSASESEMLEHASSYGGLIGFVSSVFFRAVLGDLGAKIILLAVFLISIPLTFGISFREIFGAIVDWIHGEETKKDEKNSGMKIRDFTRENAEKEKPAEQKKPAAEKAKPQDPRSKSGTSFTINQPGAIKLADEFKPQKSRVKDADWVPPSLDLLADAEKAASINEDSLHRKADSIKHKLSQFGIDVEMYDVNVGPAVMQYTLKPNEGVKLSKIVNLKNDLALALAAESLRIEAPIPGKSLVGIEIPNEKRTVVRLKEILLSEDFNKMKSNLRLVLGRDVAGKPMVADLAEMPHLLVAGATGSGKSVGINTFLLSLIYQNSPNDLRLILVDPKMVEFAPYNGIPHLLTPVINEPDKTVSALKWAVAEMTRRYRELKKVKVRNITEFNQQAKDEDRLPFIVIVIDELADLMMVASKEVEGCIMRIAQMARAVGIHLILATQRPSVNVITGVIKANIPTRLSFAVTSGIDSKTILDSTGAEDLLGMGDMLFIPPGQSKPVRIQGTYIATDEVRKVVNAIKLDLGDEEPEYNDEITDSTATASVELPGVKAPAPTGNSDEDLTLQAARVVVETGRASASLLQRRLSVGYARAARLIDVMEERGWVGPAAGAKPRDILLTPDKLAEFEGGGAENSAANNEEIRNQLDAMERSRGDF